MMSFGNVLFALASGAKKLRCITNCYKLKWSGSLVQQVNVPQVAVGVGVGVGVEVSCDMLISICHLFLVVVVVVVIVVFFFIIILLPAGCCCCCC